MIKTRGQGGRAQVTFTLDGAVGAMSAAVCGEFNNWFGDGHVMARAADGSFTLTIELDTGRRYRFRYLLDGSRWENDWAADDYVPNAFGGDDSVVDLTALSEPVPSAGKKTGAAQKAVAAKKAAPAKKTPVQKAAAKKAAPAKAAAPAKGAATKGAAKKAAAPAKKAPAKKKAGS